VYKRQVIISMKNYDRIINSSSNASGMTVIKTAIEISPTPAYHECLLSRGDMPHFTEGGLPPYHVCLQSRGT